MLLAVPALLMLAAELRMGAFAAGWLAGQPQTLMIVAPRRRLHRHASSSAACDRLTWSGSAEAIAAILALIVPVAIVAVMVTNFPLPQLTNGPLLRALMHTEAAQALSVVDAPALAFASARRRLHPYRQALHGAVRRHRSDRLRRRHADGDGGRRLLAVAASRA